MTDERWIPTQSSVGSGRNIFCEINEKNVIYIYFLNKAHETPDYFIHRFKYSVCHQDPTRLYPEFGSDFRCIVYVKSFRFGLDMRLV